jgi:hypothetical protein
MNKQIQVVLVKKLQLTYKLDNVAKAHKHTKHKKVKSIVKQKGGYSMILLTLEPFESNHQEHDDREKRNRSSF